MRPLYEIDEDLQAIFEGAQVDEDGEYLIDYDALKDLEMERQQKFVGVALGVKNMDAEEEMLDKEIKALQDRKRSVRNRKEGLKVWLKYNLDGQPVKDSKVSITFRKAPASVEVVDAGKLPSPYFRVKTEPNKTAIKEALQNGIKVPGAILVTDNIAMVIK